MQREYLTFISGAFSWKSLKILCLKLLRSCSFNPFCPKLSASLSMFWSAFVRTTVNGILHANAFLAISMWTKNILLLTNCTHFVIYHFFINTFVNSVVNDNQQMIVGKKFLLPEKRFSRILIICTAHVMKSAIGKICCKIMVNILHTQEKHLFEPI